jgi:hypothetical protein
MKCTDPTLEATVDPKSLILYYFIHLLHLTYISTTYTMDAFKKFATEKIQEQRMSILHLG